MSYDESVFHAAHKKSAEAKAAESAPLPDKSIYKKFTTLEAKTHMSRILREMERGDFDGAIITSYGREVGYLFPERRLRGK